MHDDPNAPCLELLVARSNSLLAAAFTVGAYGSPDAVKKLAREYEAFIDRPVGEDPESDRPSTLTAVRIGGASDGQSQTA